MTAWETVFRTGFAPLLTTEQLTALLDGLRNDDPRILQCATCSPPPLMCVQDWPVESACAIGFCGADANGGFGTATVGQVEEFFDRVCCGAVDRLGESARHFIDWFDSRPRSEVFAALIPVVADVLQQRISHQGADRQR